MIHQRDVGKGIGCGREMNGGAVALAAVGRSWYAHREQKSESRRKAWIFAGRDGRQLGPGGGDRRTFLFGGGL